MIENEITLKSRLDIPFIRPTCAVVVQRMRAEDLGNCRLGLGMETLSTKRVEGLILMLLVTSIALLLLPDVHAATGSLSVSTGLSEVTVSIGTVSLGSTDSWGGARFDGLSEGLHDLRLSKAGYKNWTKQVAIASEKTTTVYAYLEHGSGMCTSRNETISYDSLLGNVKLQAGQEGVNVYLGGEYGGATSTWNDATVNGLIAGTYTLKLSKPGYNEWMKNVTITGGKTTAVYAYLEQGAGTSATRIETLSYDSPLGSLNVQAEQEGVNTYVEEEYGGATSSWNDVTVEGLIDGNYTLRLSKPGYKQWMKRVTITVGKTTTVHATLEAGTGEMTTRNEILAFDSPIGKLQVESDWDNQGTKAYVDGEYAGELETYGSREVNGLIAGIYTLKLERNGFKTWTKQVMIAVGRTTTVYSYLELGAGTAITRQETISYNTAFGSLRVNANQSGVSLYVGGEYGGTTDTSYDRTIEGLVEGKYDLTLIKSGCQSSTSEVTISAGQTAQVSIELISDTNTSTRPKAVTLSTSGSDQHTAQLAWSQNADGDFSSYEIYVSTSSGTLGDSVTQISGRANTNYEVTGLNPSTIYHFTLRVWNAANEFSDSNQITVATLAVDGAPPLMPDIFTVSLAIFLLVVIAPLSAVVIYRRRNAKNNYSRASARVERERADRERIEWERRKAEEERQREERRRAEEQRRADQQRRQTASNLNSLFDVLGVPYNATRDQVRDAYRQLSKKWHPDMFKDSDERAKELANEKFSKISVAYEEILKAKGWSK